MGWYLQSTRALFTANLINTFTRTVIQALFSIDKQLTVSNTCTHTNMNSGMQLRVQDFAKRHFSRQTAAGRAQTKYLLIDAQLFNSLWLTFLIQLKATDKLQVILWVLGHHILSKQLQFTSGSLKNVSPSVIFPSPWSGRLDQFNFIPTHKLNKQIKDYQPGVR